MTGKPRFAVDFFGTLFDAPTAIDRFIKRHPEYASVAMSLKEGLLDEEHYRELLTLGTLLESAPRNTYVYYVDHPRAPLDAIKKWLNKRKQPDVPVVRLHRGDPQAYIQLKETYQITAFIDDNPPLILRHLVDFPFVIPAREWNNFRYLGTWERINMSIKEYEQSFLNAL